MAPGGRSVTLLSAVPKNPGGSPFGCPHTPVCTEHGARTDGVIFKLGASNTFARGCMLFISGCGDGRL